MSFQGKTAIVTGGAQGMGMLSIRGFAQGGANVAIFDVNEVEGKSVAEDLSRKGTKAIFLKVDVTSRYAVNEAVKTVEQEFGKVDILVNTVGTDWPGPFINSNEDTWEKLMALNFKSVLYTTKAVLDGMVARKYGKIINVASDAGRIGVKGETVYGGCKAALIGFARGLAAELGSDNITVNTVSPGPTETPSFKIRSRGYERLVEEAKKGIVLGRFGQSEDVAEAILFLASDKASFITGQVISVSGGLSMV